MRFFLAAAILLAPAAAQAAQCSYFDAGTDELVEARCTVAYESDGEIITLGERNLVFVQQERQGQWATGTLDGAPAMRYEINRETFSYATRDLTRFLDLSLR